MMLYRGSGKYYVEHLIFSLHFYSFDFLAKCVIAVIYLASDYVGDTTFAAARFARLLHRRVGLFALSLR